MIRKAFNIATVTAILAASAGTAFAGVDTSTISTQAATLNFGATQQVLHTLTAVSNLSPSLQAADVLANGTVSTADGVPATFAIKYSDKSSIVPDGTYPRHATINGDQDSTHKLKVELAFDGIDAQGVGHTDGWYPTPEAVANLAYTVISDVEQTVPVDTYTVSVDAGIWTE
ncbi:TPA: AfaD family invasin [Klebsiella aerogenes]